MTPASLLDVARELAISEGPGAPSQARVRRSLSTSYYAAFHAALGLLASQGAGVTAPADQREAVKRSVSHTKLARVAEQIIAAPKHLAVQQERDRAAKNLRFELRHAGWSDYMNDLITLQKIRHDADYDLAFRVYKSQAITAHAQARRLCEFLGEHGTGLEGRSFYLLVAY